MKHFLTILLLGGAGLLAVALWGRATGRFPWAPARPNLIVLCADTLRRDHLGLYGYPRPTSPNLDRLASRGLRFDRAYATSSWTGPSVLSLFTSEPPHVHGFQAATAVYDGRIETLAQALSARGYRTGAVSANFVHVTPERGFAAGFDYFNVLKGEAPGGASLRSDYFRYDQVRAHRVFEAGLSWIRRKDGRPYFLYLQTMDTHPGYKATASAFRVMDRGGPRRLSGTAIEVNALQRGDLEPTPGDVAHLVDVYDAAVASWDEALGTFLAALEKEGALENTVVVVLSDHGEEFQDHGSFFHGVTLYDEMIRVPLVLVLPDGRFGGRAVNGPVSLLDVAPTLLALAGAREDRWHAGRSLLALLDGSPPRRIIEAELGPDPMAPDFDAVPRRHRVAVLEGGWKVILGLQGLEVYRTAEDPGERRRLAAGEVPDLRPAIEEAKRVATAQGVEGAYAGTVDPDLEARLRSLGYAR